MALTVKSTFFEVFIMHFFTSKSYLVPLYKLPLSSRFAGKGGGAVYFLLLKPFFKDDLEDLLLLAVAYSLVSTTEKPEC